MAIIVTVAVLSCHGVAAGLHQAAPDSGMPAHHLGHLAYHGDEATAAGEPGNASIEPVGALALLIAGVLWLFRRLQRLHIPAPPRRWPPTAPLPAFRLLRPPPSQPRLQVFRL